MVCEKVSEECPNIGHVNTGIDFDAIRRRKFGLAKKWGITRFQ
jgi:hypothetical protein